MATAAQVLELAAAEIRSGSNAWVADAVYCCLLFGAIAPVLQQCRLAVAHSLQLGKLILILRNVLVSRAQINAWQGLSAAAQCTPIAAAAAAGLFFLFSTRAQAAAAKRC
jgi:hypothetical protein